MGFVKRSVWVFWLNKIKLILIIGVSCIFINECYCLKISMIMGLIIR